ncbi:MAG: hypothetical protein R2705_01350 [Ilumatobacteraceae bacterium]
MWPYQTGFVDDPWAQRPDAVELVAESMDESWYGIARDPEQARAMLSNPALAAAS